MSEPLNRRTFLRVSGLSLSVAAVAGCSFFSTDAKKTTTSGVAADAGAKESPALARLVKDGKLPPLEQRLPKTPMVLKPIQSPGKYGGVLQRGSIDRNAAQNGYVEFAGLVEWTPTTPAKVGPGLAEKWEVLDGGKVYVFHLREGLKWSDGKPFTTDDLMFTYEKSYLNKELNPIFPGWLSPGGKPGKFVKVDDHTLRMEFAVPHGLLLRYLCFIGLTGFDSSSALLLPAHYLKQFHKDFATPAQIQAEMKKNPAPTWADFFKSRRHIWKNADVPVLGPWKLVAPLRGSGVTARLERNPYYWKVDEQGRQLPYIDSQQYTVMPAETLGLRAANGQLDLQVTDIQAEQLPLLIRNQESKGYKVNRWVAEPNTSLNFNQSHPDPVLRELFQKLDFRAGLSHAINRKEMNDALLAGQGFVRHPCAQPEDEYWEDGMGQRFIAYDVAEANKRLDAAGLMRRGADGMRLRPDGKKLQLVGRCFEVGVGIAAITVLEYARRYWKAVGIDLVPKPISLDLWYEEIPHGDYDLVAYPPATILWDIDSLWYIPTSGLTYWAPKYGNWYGDPKGKFALEPTGDIRKLQTTYDELLITADDTKRLDLGRQILRLHDENVWIIGTVATPFQPLISAGDLRNVRPDAIASFRTHYENASAPEQMYFDNPDKHV
ncbi:ABC transporter substrate-binding protein [Kribbella sp. NBC_01505]|uniref:ABC transporter substrate-binding protein n=1 Tax=Kribbella sp. NBC_01505 TaxID=2903580 RepID=UPI00386ED17C